MQNREKQIEEMAIIYEEARYKASETLGSMNEGAGKWYAKAFYNAGYRKASEVEKELADWKAIAEQYQKQFEEARADVARETVKAIMEKASEKEQYMSDLYGYGGFMIATTDLEDIIRRYIFDTYEEAELKKKYTEEQG